MYVYIHMQDGAEVRVQAVATENCVSIVYFIDSSIPPRNTFTE